MPYCPDCHCPMIDHIHHIQDQLEQYQNITPLDQFVLPHTSSTHSLMGLLLLWKRVLITSYNAKTEYIEVQNKTTDDLTRNLVSVSPSSASHPCSKSISFSELSSSLENSSNACDFAASSASNFFQCFKRA